MRVNRFFVVVVGLLYICAAVFLLVGVGAAAAGELIDNGGMESPFVDGVARGWHANRWGSNTATYSPGPGHSGQSSQEIACQSFDNGGVAIRSLLKSPIVSGRRYTVSLWMKAGGFVGMVRVSVRTPKGALFNAWFEPNETWQRYQFEGVSGKSGEQAELIIISGDAGNAKLWIDDVSVAESEPQMAVTSPVAGNVIPNADFEIDLDRDWQCRGADARLDDVDPFHGQRSLRFDLDSRPVQFSSRNGDRPAQFSSRPIEFTGDGHTFTLAMACRARGDASVSAKVWPAVKIGAREPLLELKCTPGAEWKVFRKTGPLPASNNGAYYVTVSFRSRQRASVWLDAVRLEPGDANGTFRCRRPIEAALTCAPVAHIYRKGKPVELAVQAYCDGDGPCTTSMACRIIDYWHHVVAKVPVSLELRPRSVTTGTIQVPLNITGVFLAELVDHDEALSGISFSVLPPVSEVPAERSAVGGHLRLDEFHMQAANAMGIKWTRLHDCETFANWDRAEPRKGQFVWRDDKVALAREHGVRLLGEFLRTPRWANPGGNRSSPPDLTEFAAYIRAVVDHYRRDIRHWEIWNEPYIKGYWSGTPEQYADMAKVAAREAHAVNPQAILLAPCIAPGYVAFVEPALAAGALDGADVFSYHAYEVLNPHRYDILRTWAATGRNKPLPIWNSETGTTSGTFYRNIPDKYVDDYTNWLGNVSYRIAAAHTAKYFVMALAGGAERFFQYWSNYEKSLPRLSAMSLFEYDSALRPMGVAYSVAASLLDGCHGHGWFDVPGPSLVVCLLEDRQRYIAVVWRGNASTLRVQLPIDPGLITARNMMGNRVETTRDEGGTAIELGSEPTYLIVSAEHADALTKALRHATSLKPTLPTITGSARSGQNLDNRP